MKTCTRCGARAVPEARFCPQCGCALTGIAPSDPPAPAAPSAPNSRPTYRHRKSSGVLFIAGAILLFVLIGAASAAGEKNARSQAMPQQPYGNYQAAPNIMMPDPNAFLPEQDDSAPAAAPRTLCVSCYGSGSCPICDGTGTYSMYGQDQDVCTACGGTGVCSICGGSGYN